jgi:AraC-like DNA-binding protein
MKAYLERVSSSPFSFVAFERHELEFGFHWHYHPEFELTLIINGSGQRLVGDGVADYYPGDLVLLGPNLSHSWRPLPAATSGHKPQKAIVVQFSQAFLGEEFFELEEMRVVAQLLQRSSRGLAFGHTQSGRRVARYLSALPSQTPARRLTTLLAALVELADECDAQVLSTVESQPCCRVADQRKIDEICHYLKENFAEEIKFAELSRLFRMDQAVLCRFFKRSTGRTMTEYINELRVSAAAQLLIHTDESVLDIGFRVGFGNYSNFNRQFKRVKGFGPRTLRQQFALLAS